MKKLYAYLSHALNMNDREWACFFEALKVLY